MQAPGQQDKCCGHFSHTKTPRVRYTENPGRSRFKPNSSLQRYLSLIRLFRGAIFHIDWKKSPEEVAKDE